MHKYAHTPLHKHRSQLLQWCLCKQLQWYRRREVISTVNESEKASGIVLRHWWCIRVRGWASQWEKASCKVLCGVTASPEPHYHHRRRRRRAIFTSQIIWLAGREFFCPQNNEKLCLPDVWLTKQTHFSLIKTFLQTADFKLLHIPVE